MRQKIITKPQRIDCISNENRKWKKVVPCVIFNFNNYVKHRGLKILSLTYKI